MFMWQRSQCRPSSRPLQHQQNKTETKPYRRMGRINDSAFAVPLSSVIGGGGRRRAGKKKNLHHIATTKAMMRSATTYAPAPTTTATTKTTSRSSSRSSPRTARAVAIALIYSISLSSKSTIANAGWVDPDTPQASRSTEALTIGDDRQYELVSEITASVNNSAKDEMAHRLVVFFCVSSLSTLYNLSSRKVFSDEFEEDGRQFHDGSDPRWTAINKNDCKVSPLVDCADVDGGDQSGYRDYDTHRSIHRLLLIPAPPPPPPALQTRTRPCTFTATTTLKRLMAC